MCDIQRRCATHTQLTCIYTLLKYNTNSKTLFNLFNWEGMTITVSYNAVSQEVICLVFHIQISPVYVCI